MKKFFLFLAAVALAMTANAKVTTISPDAENDALRLAVHYAEDGDIIEMTEGTYVQCNNGYVAFDGKSVTVKAAEGANVVLQLQVPITITNGGKASLQGIKIDASRLNDLADWYEHVIYANDATEGKELVMQGCELYGFNINKSAIYSSSSNTLALCDIKDCYFHENMKSCFFFEGASIAELSVVNSTFANIATDPASYYAGIVDVRNADAKVTVDHCTFYNCLLINTDYAAVTMKGPQAANVVISNNIFMLPEAIDGHRAIRNDVEATNCMTFNYVKDNGGIHSSVTKTNCFLNVDPMFVDAANGNYALAEGSPALGAATDGSDLGDPRWNKKTDVEPVDPVKPEPTYTENKLNTYAFGLESELTEETLNVTYRLNNSNATSVNVLVYKGEEVVATVAGGTSIGKNVVEIATADLPQGRMLTWSVEVNGTSVEAPTQEEKIYSFYHPSGMDIDNNPENPTFGMLLINEGMHSVKSIEGYVSSSFGAGIFAFTPSLDLIPNGELPGYNGGIEFTNGRADASGSTAYSPRRIRISEDGRIFVTSLNTDGNYLWEVNPDNMDEWTTVFQGTLNDNKELIDADSNFVAAPNNGFDVKGAGENLQLAMYSVNLPGITAAAMSGFRLHEYNLGTATTWATAPSKTIVDGLYAINYTGTQVEYDNEGGVWIASYRGTASDANPGLVHINADGVEDAKLLWNNVRQAGIRFNNDFTKLVVAGNNGAAKKATIYAVSKDANGAPVLTEETVIDMAAVGNNLNDFAFDYAGNLYACGNSAEKLIGYAMPYSGTVVTPAASKYAFHIGELLPDPAVVTEMVGVVKRAVQNGESTIVLTHETDGTAHIYEITNGTILELLQNGVVPVDPENKGSYLAISDIAVTEDGKLVANNYVRNQFAGTAPEAGYLVGTSYYYIWNDLHDAPSVWFTSQTTARSSHGDVGVTFALKGTSTNAELLVTAVHNNNRAVRLAKYNIIDGQYVEPNIPGGQQSSEYYEYFGTHTKEAYYQEAVQGKQFQLNVSPLGDNNWIMDGELVDPSEFVLPGVGENYAASATLTEDLGKKFNGATYVTVGEKVLMVAPYATPEGKLTGVEILDITGGLDAAQYVDQLFIDEAVEATAAATAVEVVEGDEATALLITLVADATIYSLEATLSNGPDYQIYEDEITNLVIDLDNLVLIGGPSSAFQVDVYLGLGDYNRNDDTYQLIPESSIAVMGSDATFIEGYAYEVDAFTPSAKAVVRCEWNGMLLEFHLTMTAAPLEATVVVVENALVEIEKYLLWGDMYDYALTMSGEWVNPADGLTYPVLVEVPVYYPEATEPSEIMSTVTVGGWGDNDPWLGFGEGTLTVTTENISDGQKLITATGIVQNPMAGVAIDITISGKIIPNALENVETTVAPVKVIKNGQLIIIKNGVEYNVQGAVVK